MSKMTIAENFDVVIGMVAKYGEVSEVDVSDALEFLADRKSKSTKSGKSKRVDNSKEMAIVSEVLSDGVARTNKELCDALEDIVGVRPSTSKMTGILSPMYKGDVPIVKREVEKGVAKFSLIDLEPTDAEVEDLTD